MKGALFALFLTGCASAPVLPVLGNALLVVENGYARLTDAQDALEAAYRTVCNIEPSPAACPALRADLDKIDPALEAARDSVNKGVKAYTDINDTLKDAGE